MKTAILAILLFLLLIFPHELGHFIAAKKCGVKVNEFSFGMGPAIFKKQKGETLYSIRILPIGGYCAMEGENEDSEDLRAFTNKKPWQKLVILFSGALMNFLIALVVLIIVYTSMGFSTKVVGLVSSNSPAEISGILPNDKILYINDIKVKDWNHIGDIIQDNKGEELNIIVNRSGKEEEINVVPLEKEYRDENGEIIQTRYEIGIQTKISHNVFLGIAYGARTWKDMFNEVFVSFKMLLFTHEAGLKDMSGPVGIIQVVGESASLGFGYFLILLSLISINLGIVNLFPLPALDGGRIIFVLYTMITKKEVNQKVESIVHAIGIVLLFGLMILITANDILRL